MDSQQDPKLSDKQMAERVQLGATTGSIVGFSLMAIVTCLAISASLTPVGLSVAIGGGFIAVIACTLGGQFVAFRWDAVMGFFGRQPKANP
jgi:hypothetical protein